MREGVAGGGWDFFVSYPPADQAWAEWIAWQLEADGYRVLVQAWDMVPGSNWTHVMQQGVQGARRTVAVLSAAYTKSLFATAECSRGRRQPKAGALRTGWWR